MKSKVCNECKVDKPFSEFNKTKDSNIKVTNDLQKLINELKETNMKLWKIEDQKRICEKNKDFGNSFVELARNVYFNNDKRAKIKSEIKEILGSNIKEIKQYSNY